MSRKKTKRIGILTAGGDSPGLNAAIRGVGKTAIGHYGMELIGFRDGITGLAQNRHTPLDSAALSGILTLGGTILGTSRDKVHRMEVDGEVRDMVPTVVANYEKEGLDGLIVIGGGGTAKNAMRLQAAGLNVLTLPKTIDNDIFGTDTSFGFATATEIATEAIDRVHSTAHSHHRIILTEVMGHRAGWLTLASGLAGGADVILIPEIPYSVEKRRRDDPGAHGAGQLVQRGRRGRGRPRRRRHRRLRGRAAAGEGRQDPRGRPRGQGPPGPRRGHPARAHLPAGPRARGRDRAGDPRDHPGLRAARRGTRAPRTGCSPPASAPRPPTWSPRAQYGFMVAARGDGTEPVPLAEVAGKVKLVPPDHDWVAAARKVGTGLGD